MSVKVFALLTKKEGLATEAFIEHYEKKHAPLAAGLITDKARPIVYKRNFVKKDATTDPSIDFDVITEFLFPDKSAYEAWVGELYGPEHRETIQTDEARFLNRAKTRAFVVEEHVTYDKS